MITVSSRWDYIVTPIVEPSSPQNVSLYLRMVGLAVRRPRVIPALVGAAWAFRDRRWYRHAPFLPLPPRSYLRWRMETAFGDPDAVPEIDDLERYLTWTSRMRGRIAGRNVEGRAGHD